MNMKQKKSDNAVSPVVGVMLMLVVTIILAAMVASFTGSVVDEQSVAPQSSLDVGYVAKIVDTDKTNEEPNGAAENNGFVFRLMSGDTFSIKDISITLKKDDTVISFDMNTILNDSAVVSEDNKLSIITNSNENRTYFAISPGASDVLGIGDTFMLLADSSFDNTLCTSAATKGRFLTWSPEGTGATFNVQTNVPIEYTIYHTPSGKAIQSGTITIR